MRQTYRDFDFKPDTLRLLGVINAVIEKYQQQGFTLSVRQIYYQLVTINAVENTERSYKRVASIINDGRLAGILDWDAIEDRGRDIVVRSRWESGSSIVHAAANSFHMDQWVNQPHRVFVIVEKAALAGVLDGVCRKWDVPLLAARGYPSVSVVRELALDHIQKAMEDDQIPIILHLGDHDPSGIDMTRDLDERIRMFAEEQNYDIEIDVDRIALTMRQIDEKNPPPNPAKTTDARFGEYRRKFGNESWELDALEPAYLVRLVESKVKALIDPDEWKKREDEIEDTRTRLKQVAEEFDAA